MDERFPHSSYERSAHLYDIFDVKPTIPFFTQLAAGVTAVLDVGAGTGRIALALAREGHRVVCIEPSPAMRTVFAHKLAAEPEVAMRIRVLAGRAERFAVEQRFPLAILCGVFDHLLNEAERRGACETIWRHLEPGGRLILDAAIVQPEARPLSPAGDTPSEMAEAPSPATPEWKQPR